MIDQRALAAQTVVATFDELSESLENAHSLAHSLYLKMHSLRMRLRSAGNNTDIPYNLPDTGESSIVGGQEELFLRISTTIGEWESALDALFEQTSGENERFHEHMTQNDVLTTVENNGIPKFVPDSKCPHCGSEAVMLDGGHGEHLIWCSAGCVVVEGTSAMLGRELVHEFSKVPSDRVSQDARTSPADADMFNQGYTQVGPNAFIKFGEAKKEND